MISRESTVKEGRWRDYGQRPVHVGDTVVEERGKVFQVLDSDPTVIRNGLASAQELRLCRSGWEATGQATYLRVYHCFAVTAAELSDQTSNKVLWERLFDTLARERVKRETQARHREADETLRRLGIRR